MHITETMIAKLIERAALEDGRAHSGAHNELVAIDEDLRQDDGRARQGMGLAPNPPTIDDEAGRLLDDYLSTH